MRLHRKRAHFVRNVEPGKSGTRVIRHLTAPEIKALLDAPKPVDGLVSIQNRRQGGLSRMRAPSIMLATCL